MDKHLRVLIKKVGEPPEEKIIKGTLNEYQKIVGGLIEVISYEDVLLICNDEGKLLQMQPNLKFDYDYIAGDCFFIGDDYENAEFKSLTNEQIASLKEMIEERAFKYSPLNLRKSIEERDY